MLQLLYDFWSFKDPNVAWVFLSSLLLGASAGAIGCFAFLEKRSLVGDALAHAALPGVAGAFLLTYSRNPLIIFFGAVISSTLGYWSSEFLVRYTKIKEDSALAIVLSLYFAAGIFLLSIIQRLPLGNQAGLDKVLFGQAASLVKSDVYVLLLVASIILIFIASNFRHLTILVFDQQYAKAIGLPTKRLRFMFSSALIFATVTGLQLVGVVLIAALLLTPAAAARYWTNNLLKMVSLAAVFGSLSGILGTQVSYMAPNMPTGPWMVVGLTAIFAISLIFAPSRGILTNFIRQKIRLSVVEEENVLRTMFKLGEHNLASTPLIELSGILAFRSFSREKLTRVVTRLIRKRFVGSDGSHYSLTPRGLRRAQTLTRRHRLWELYLSQKLNLPADHVHADAEEIEHILTPELEAALLAEINFSSTDPHGKQIPFAYVPHEGVKK